LERRAEASDNATMTKIVERIARDLGIPDLVERLLDLPGADLTSLLLEVARRRSVKLTPADLLRPSQAYPPGDFDARQNLDLVAAAFRAAPAFEAVELSPICPVGTNTVLGGIDQMNVLATVRGSEVLADPTTALALVAAQRTPPVRLCASARVVRYQPLSSPWHRRHFRQFALVTAGRVDPAEALREHIRVYLDLMRGLSRFHFPGLQVAVCDFAARTDVDALLEPLRGEYPEARFTVDSERTQGDGYYRGLALTLTAEANGRPIHIGDGGFSDWMARLCSDRKERFLGTGIGVEAVLRFFRR
jgi:hypothetical protein